MAAKELRDIRKEMFAEMEQRLNVNRRGCNLNCVKACS